MPIPIRYFLQLESWRGWLAILFLAFLIVLHSSNQPSPIEVDTFISLLPYVTILSAAFLTANLFQPQKIALFEVASTLPMTYSTVLLWRWMVTSILYCVFLWLVLIVGLSVLDKGQVEPVTTIWVAHITNFVFLSSLFLLAIYYARDERITFVMSIIVIFWFLSGFIPESLIAFDPFTFVSGLDEPLLWWLGRIVRLFVSVLLFRALLQRLERAEFLLIGRSQTSSFTLDNLWGFKIFPPTVGMVFYVALLQIKRGVIPIFAGFITIVGLFDLVRNLDFSINEVLSGYTALMSIMPLIAIPLTCDWTLQERTSPRYAQAMSMMPIPLYIIPQVLGTAVALTVSMVLASLVILGFGAVIIGINQTPYLMNYFIASIVMIVGGILPSAFFFGSVGALLGLAFYRLGTTMLRIIALVGSVLVAFNFQNSVLFHVFYPLGRIAYNSARHWYIDQTGTMQLYLNDTPATIMPLQDTFIFALLPLIVLLYITKLGMMVIQATWIKDDIH